MGPDKEFVPVKVENLEMEVPTPKSTSGKEEFKDDSDDKPSTARVKFVDRKNSIYEWRHIPTDQVCHQQSWNILVDKPVVEIFNPGSGEWQPVQAPKVKAKDSKQ